MSQGLSEIHDPAEWDRAVEPFEFVPPGQTASWSESHYFRGYNILRFVSAKPGAIAVQGILKRSLGITRFIVEDGPILGKVCNEEAFLAFVTALRERLGKTSIISFSSIQAHEPVHEIWLRKAGFQRPWSTALSPLTLYVDCHDNSRLEQGFSANWRKSIRKAERNGLVFETAALSNACARGDLFALCFETLQIKGVAMPIDVPMLEALGRDLRWRLFFASHAGKRVSARLVFVSGRSAFDAAAGTSAQGRKLSATHFLMASVLKHLGQSGVHWFDFGRIGPGRYDAIDFFKHGSGGRPIVYLGEWTLSSHPWLELMMGTVQFFKRHERW